MRAVVITGGSMELIPVLSLWVGVGTVGGPPRAHLCRVFGGRVFPHKVTCIKEGEGVVR
jgi:hypothetical protein